VILVKIELHSAVTHRVTELGRVKISNDGTGHENCGNYNVELIDKNGRTFARKRVTRFPRRTKSIWALLRLALHLGDEGE
jgi:hypothetical protein